MTERRKNMYTMDRELTLDELLNEPIVRLLMGRDGVEAHEIRQLVKTIGSRILARDDSRAHETADTEPCRDTELDLLRATEAY